MIIFIFDNLAVTLRHHQSMLNSRLTKRGEFSHLLLSGEMIFIWPRDLSLKCGAGESDEHGWKGEGES